MCWLALANAFAAVVVLIVDEGALAVAGEARGAVPLHPVTMRSWCVSTSLRISIASVPLMDHPRYSLPSIVMLTAAGLGNPLTRKVVATPRLELVAQ